MKKKVPEKKIKKNFFFSKIFKKNFFQKFSKKNFIFREFFFDFLTMLKKSSSQKKMFEIGREMTELWALFEKKLFFFEFFVSEGKKFPTFLSDSTPQTFKSPLLFKFWKSVEKWSNYDWGGEERKRPYSWLFGSQAFEYLQMTCLTSRTFTHSLSNKSLFLNCSATNGSFPFSPPPPPSHSSPIFRRIFKT